MARVLRTDHVLYVTRVQNAYANSVLSCVLS